MRFVDPQSALAGFLEQESINREQGLFPTFEKEVDSRRAANASRLVVPVLAIPDRVMTSVNKPSMVKLSH